MAGPTQKDHAQGPPLTPTRPGDPRKCCRPRPILDRATRPTGAPSTPLPRPGSPTRSFSLLIPLVDARTPLGFQAFGLLGPFAPPAPGSSTSCRNLACSARPVPSTCVSSSRDRCCELSAIAVAPSSVDGRTLGFPFRSVNSLARAMESGCSVQKLELRGERGDCIRL